MSPTVLESYRVQLTTLAQRLRRGVGNLRDEAFSAPAGVGEMSAEQADTASHQAEEDRIRFLLGNESSILAEVEAALERLEAGTFGRCVGCNKAIPVKRLEALPYARECIPCAEAREQAEAR